MRNSAWALLWAAMVAAPLRAEIGRVPEVDASASVSGPLLPAAPAPLAAPLPASAALPALPAAAAAPAPRAARTASGALRGAPLSSASPHAPSIEAAAAESSAFFDQAISKALAENPDRAAEIESRLSATAYGSSLRGDEWKSEVARVLGPRLVLGAKQSGFSNPRQYAAMLRSDSPRARAARADLVRFLGESTSHHSESRTYLLRDSSLWGKPLEEYLDRLIAKRKSEGGRRLDLQSVGAAYGSEAYTLAIVTDRALRRAGEDPADWDVAIRAYDVSLVSLLSAGRGVFRLQPWDTEAFEKTGAAAYFEPGPSPGIYRLKPELRRWIRPAFADLNDVSQHAIPKDAPADVVFANYLLYHLRLDPAARLANYWLAGKWAENGFLSMAQVVIGETGASPRAPAPQDDIPLLRRFDGNVGHAGRANFGDTLSAPGGLGSLWRDFIRGLTSDGRRAKAATEAFDAALHDDPFHAAPVDADALAALEGISRRYGVEVLLTNEPISAAYDRENGRLYVGAGAVLAPGLAKSVSRWAAEEMAGVPQVSAPAAPRVSGTGVQGIALTLEPRENGTVLRWLDRSFTPITTSFRGENADKSEEEIKAYESHFRPPQRVKIYGLN